MIRGLVVVLAAITVATALLWMFQRRLIYFPDPQTPAVETALPEAEQVNIETSDGLTLAGWYLRAPNRSKGTVLVFNGNAGNRSHRVPLARALSAHGYGVLLFDYRGYGGNPGSPSEAGLHRDASAAREYLETRADVDPRRIVYFGESLGAAVAVGLAVDRPPAALVLRSPFTSLADMGRAHYPLLPSSLLLRDRYDSLSLVPSIEVPIAVVLGGSDKIVPPVQSRRIFEAARQPKHLVVVEGVGHNDPELGHGSRMISDVVAFLDVVTP